MFSLFKKTIASVVADLELKVQHLEALAVQHAKEAEGHAILAFAAERNKIESSALAQKAQRIATRIKELVE